MPVPHSRVRVDAIVRAEAVASFIDSAYDSSERASSLLHLYTSDASCMSRGSCLISE